MADVNISKYRASVVRDGSKPASPGFVVSEGQDPVNPPGTNNFVPYTGATANVELGEFGVEAGFVTLDTTPTNIPTEQGAIYWDDSRSTAALIMNGTLQHIGQDTFFYVKNSSAYTIPKGTCVRFAGTDGASGHLLILPFTANGAFPSSYFMGVTAEDIANGEFGQVMHFGELTGIDTTGYTAGALLYASSTVAGAFQTTAPLAPNNIVLVAAAVNSKVNGAIVVRPTLGSNFGTNESVKLTSVTDKDLLQYTVTAGIGVWENKTLSQVIGSAYVPSTRTITINGTTQDLSDNRTFNVGDMLLDTIQTVTARKDYNNNTLQLVVNGTSQKTVLTNSAIDSGSYSLAINAFGFNASNNLYFSKGGNNNGIFAFSNAATRTYTLKDASGTLAFTSDIPSLSGYVQGSGTTNYVSKFTASGTIGNSQIFDNGTNVGIGTSSPTSLLSIGGVGNAISFDTTGAAGSSKIRTVENFKLSLFCERGTTSEIKIGNENLEFLTSATLRFTINPTGFVSAGATTNGRLGVRGFTNDSSGYAFEAANASGNTLFIVRNDGVSTFVGSVGINTFSPLTKLMVQDSANTYVAHFSGLNQSNGIAIGTNSSNVAVIQGYTRTFSATNNIAMQVDGGNVGIGTASPQVAGGGYTGLHINGNGASIILSTNGSNLTYFYTSGTGGVDFSIENSGAQIFRAGSSERARITSVGNVLIGTATDSGNGILQVNKSTTNAVARFTNPRNTSGDFVLVTDLGSNCNNTSSYHYIAGTGGADKFYLYGNGTYATVSDRRLKKNIESVTEQFLEKVLYLDIVTYNWNDQKDGSDLELGMIAQQVETAFPSIVKTNRPDLSGQTYKSIQASALPYILIKAIQELKQEIDKLKN